jgi:L-alanine-DL-glutamate epimerase-like enolase superfamily enzyme
MRRLSVRVERWPIAGAFTIARGTKRQAEVVVVEIDDGPARGRGEAVPYGRYGETVGSVVGRIEDLRSHIEAGGDREQLQRRLDPGAARNALDCALWDLEAKLTGVRAWTRAGLGRPRAVETAFTISLASPTAMAEAAVRAARRPILKLKIGGPDDLDRVARCGPRRPSR